MARVRPAVRKNRLTDTPEDCARPPRDVQMRLLATGCKNGRAALMVSNQKVVRTSYLFSLP